MKTVRITFTPVDVRKIDAIKALRTLSGTNSQGTIVLGLKEAKDIVESGVYACPEDQLAATVKMLREYTTNVYYDNNREASVARLVSAYKVIEDRVVIRVATKLAEWIERV